MKAKGFAFDASPTERPTIQSELGRLVGPTVEGARQNGYTSAAESPSLTPDTGSQVSGDPAIENALSAEDGSGCFADADHSMFESRVGSTALDLYRALLGGSGSVIEIGLDRSPAFQALLKTWSECMQAAGYQFKNPGEALMSLGPPRASGQPPTDQELLVAVADATCRATSRWTEVVTTEYSTVVSGWINEHNDAVLQLREAASIDVAAIKKSAGT
jgi:hypothetical protein